MYTLITGASSGIGYELAKICAKEGQNLILVARSQEALNSLASELIQNFKIKAEVLAIDLAQAHAVNELHQHIQNRSWEVNILINNAGFGDYGYFFTSSWEKQRNVIQVNIMALTQLTHFFLPYMVKRKNGKIMNIASTAAFQPGPLMSVYYASKAFVLSFSEALAAELEGTGVTITALCPGTTQSGFQKVARFSNLDKFNTSLIPSSHQVAEFAFRSMMQDRVVAVHGMKNKLLILSVRFFPRSIMRKIMMRFQKDR